MLSLIITACLSTHPGVCREFQLPLAVPETNQGMCQMIGQIEAAKPGGWQDNHRGWIIQEYHCARPTPTQKARKIPA